jgi:hypothetical protein
MDRAVSRSYEGNKRSIRGPRGAVSGRNPRWVCTPGSHPPDLTPAADERQSSASRRPLGLRLGHLVARQLPKPQPIGPHGEEFTLDAASATANEDKTVAARPVEIVLLSPWCVSDPGETRPVALDDVDVGNRVAHPFRPTIFGERDPAPVGRPHRRFEEARAGAVDQLRVAPVGTHHYEPVYAVRTLIDIDQATTAGRPVSPSVMTFVEATT